MRTDYTDDEIAGFRPRARHFMHTNDHRWDGDLYAAWIGVQWDIFKDCHGIDQTWGSSVEVHDQFTAWISARCVCQQTPGECVAGSAVPDPPSG